MIKTLIFDFGNVFINLDIDGTLKKTHEVLNIDSISKEIVAFNSFYEQGLISTQEFLDFYLENFPNIKKNEIIDLWNSILKDFPIHRLEFLKKLKATGEYKLILLSNTNEIHINYIKDNVPFFEDFKNQFDAFYLSNEINLIKPNREIFEFVLKKNNLSANECLFIDDNHANIVMADLLKINTWHINPNNEDVSNLLKVKAGLF